LRLVGDVFSTGRTGTIEVMGKYEDEYKELNAAQRQAVDETEGPVLVVAGPGTGKTQLLSMRVANMRDRLIGIIGQPAYHVAIHTFHSFGADVINQYPDYFTDRQLLQQIDELGRYELLQDIFEQLPHGNPLGTKVGDEYIFIKNTLDVISWLKQNAVAPNELHELLLSNHKIIEATASELAECFTTTPSPKSLPAYQKLLKTIQKHVSGRRYYGFPEYAAEAAAELERAIAETPADGRFAKPITAWRNAWAKKDAEGKHVWKDGGQNYRRLQAVANVYQALVDVMAARGLYDFDDMVILAVHAMEHNDELRFNLQERYQYILVDEFQDTNKAQLRMLGALGDNPVHENRPNIMAVGDDDQAIYAFQGAEVSNMVAFSQLYDQPTRITLDENFRSNANILKLSGTIAEQISDRLETAVPEAHKQLAARRTHPTKILECLSFSSELAQYDWIAEQIAQLIKDGAQPEDIAVIAPRHRYLERLMPYLRDRRVPVAYERRDNILEAPIIVELLTMARLVVAIAKNRQDEVDALLGQVLGYDFWDIPADSVIRISLECYDTHKHWLEVLTKHKDKKLRDITAWLTRLAKRSPLEPVEYVIDELVGTAEDGVDSEYDDLLLPRVKAERFVSPMRQYYFNPKRYEDATDTYLTLLGQLSTLRHRLRQWQPYRTLYIKDLVEFAELHQSAHLKIVDTNPHTQTTNAVQVMTAYKAKGLEFGAVFVINAQDEVWGPTARSGSSRIALPRNLPIEPAGNSDDDRLRLLFVALTRAKHTLYITGYTHSLDNKLSPPLSFLAGQAGFETRSLDKPASAQASEILSKDWAYRFRQIIADKPSLFEPILTDYKLSVTHLNNFIDLQNAGPEYFLTHNLLRFPEALSPSAAYGDAIHKTLQWGYGELRTQGALPAIPKMQAYFADMLGRTHLRATDYKRLEARGREALERYLKARAERFSAKDMAERGFNNEGVVVNEARLSGKIDLLHFTDGGQVEVRDFKTGKPVRAWQGKDEYEKVKLHKYRQQLLFYKLLVENSASFARRLTVTSGALEFIEPDDEGRLVDNLELSFEPDELTRFAALIGAVWQHIMSLSFPNPAGYPPTLKGIQQFEQDLIDGAI